VARAEGQQGRGAGPGQGEIDAWREGKQEVERRRQQSGGQGRGTAGGGKGSKAEHVLREEEERGGGPGDLFVKTKNFRDLSVKKDFPLI
jgi:hypothetical protein